MSTELVEKLLSFSKTSEGPVDALTTEELAELANRSTRWVRLQLKKAIDAGLMEVTTKMLQDISGKLTKRPAYKMKGKKK